MNISDAAPTFFGPEEARSIALEAYATIGSTAVSSIIMTSTSSLDNCHDLGFDLGYHPPSSWGLPTDTKARLFEGLSGCLLLLEVPLSFFFFFQHQVTSSRFTTLFYMIALCVVESEPISFVSAKSNDLKTECNSRTYWKLCMDSQCRIRLSFHRPHHHSPLPL